MAMTTGWCVRAWERRELRRLLMAGAVMAGMAVATPAHANPSGEQVRRGAAAFSRNGSTLTIRQHTDRAIIDWQDFSIGQGELTRFVQPGAGSAVLNRVISGNPSSLQGRLRANGQVYLINPNGVLVGPDATIQTQSFVASTLDAGNEAFMVGGDLLFAGDSAAGIANHGVINALGGDVFLIARTVENAGTIEADGTAGLAAGSEVLLKQAGDQRLFVQAGAGSAEVGVANEGTVQAAHAELTAAGGNVYALAINNDGVVRATGVEQQGGRIRLVAEDGKVRVAGTLDASHDEAAGGSVHVLGEQIELQGATLEASGATGGGMVRVGGDWQGGGTLLTAQSTTVDAGTTLRADATVAGDGGEVVVWSDGTTTYHGHISARGAGAAGHGGDAEVSGKQHLLVTGHADLRAPGNPAGAGSFLLDPGSVTIVDGAGAPSGAMDTFTDGWVNTQLGSGSLTITTAGSTNGATEDLTVDAGAAVSWASGNDLTLLAGNDLTVAGSIISTGAGSLTLRADTDADGAGTVGVSGAVQATGGGDVAIYYNPTSYASPTDYSGGVSVAGGGSFTAWMLVNDVTDLQAMENNLAGDYALNADIDASDTANWNSGAGFNPVGGFPNDFDGTFDGEGHTITGLFINRPGLDRVGLFGRIDDATVRDVVLTDVDITGDAVVGGLAGQSYGTITDVSVSGAVTGSSIIGGLVGQIEGAGTLTQSHASATVNGGAMAGGLVGSNIGTISQSFATGDVSGASIVGGLVGYAFHDSQTTDVYATGDVTGGSSVGGLIGRIEAPFDPFDPETPGTVTNAFASGQVTGDSNVGGLVGAGDASNVSNSFYDSDTTGQNTSVGGTGKTTAELLTEATYTDAGWDVAGDWFMVEGQTRPFLRMEHSTTITNAHQLQLVAMDVDGDYTLAADLDLSTAGLDDASGMWGGAGFVPIRDGGTAFTGTFDGGGHTISNLFIDQPGATGVGLFASLGAGAEVDDVGLLGVDITGNQRVGALAGENNGGAIRNVYATGEVNATVTVGGLVGYNTGAGSTISGSHAGVTVTASSGYGGGLVGNHSNDAAISDSYTTGDVTGLFYIGGLAGQNFNATIDGSYATGDVTGTDRVGGLVGNSTGTIDRSYATGNVTGEESVGGLVGYSSNTISDAYATGSVSSSSGDNNVGGLVGMNHSGTINRSYATGAVSGAGYFTGGLAGRNYQGTISEAYATGAVSSSDDAVGGLVGENYQGTISDAYAVGAVTSNGNLVGGLVGYNYLGNVTNSFWDTQTTGQSTSDGGTGKTTEQMLQQATFTDAGWDFDSVWAIEGGSSLPYFQWRYPTGVQVVRGTLEGAAAGETVTLAANGSELASLLTLADGSFYVLLEPGTVGDGGGVLAWGGGGNAFGISDGDAADLTGLDLSANRLLVNSPLAEATHAALEAARGGLNDAGILYSVTDGDLTLDAGVGFTLASGTSYNFTGHLTTDADIVLDGTTTAAEALTLTGDDVSINDDLSITGSGEALTVVADGTITLGAGASLTTERGEVTFHSDRDGNAGGAILLATGSQILTDGGPVLFSGGNHASVVDLMYSGRAVGTAANPDGVRIDGATIDTTSADDSGSIRINGLGGATGNDYGVHILNGATLDNLTPRNGNITINGTGGTAGSSNHGIRIDGNNTVISSGDGYVNITGTGGSGDDSAGILVQGGARFTSTWTGGLMLNGTGGEGDNASRGIRFEGGSVIDWGTGDVILIGTGRGAAGGHDNAGIRINNGLITAEHASILITGHGGLGTHSNGVELFDDRTVIGGDNFPGSISIKTDSIRWGDGSITGTSNSTLVIRHTDPAATMGVGDGAAGDLVIDQTMLDRVGDSMHLYFGSRDVTGDIDVGDVSTNGWFTARTSGAVAVNGQISANGWVVFHAGTDLTVTGDVSAAAGEVGLRVGQADGGGTLTLDGEVSAGGGISAFGGDGDDIFHINTLVSDLTLNAYRGNDTVNTSLFANAAQTLEGGLHPDTLNIDGQGATLRDDDSPLTAEGFGTLTYSGFQPINLTNVTIGESGDDGGHDPDPPGQYEAIDNTSGKYLVEHRDGSDRNLTDEQRDVTDTPTLPRSVGQPTPGARGQAAGGGLNRLYRYDRGGGGQVRGDGRNGGWLIGASSFDLADDTASGQGGDGADDDQEADE